MIGPQAEIARLYHILDAARAAREFAGADKGEFPSKSFAKTKIEGTDPPIRFAGRRFERRTLKMRSRQRELKGTTSRNRSWRRPGRVGPQENGPPNLGEGWTPSEVFCGFDGEGRVPCTRSCGRLSRRQSSSVRLGPPWRGSHTAAEAPRPGGVDARLPPATCRPTTLRGGATSPGLAQASSPSRRVMSTRS